MKVAVTVDDVPAHGDLLPGMTRVQITRSVLDALKENGVKQAYGFANGRDAVRGRDARGALRLWLGSGYPVGNHTFSHSDLDKIGTERYLIDIDRMQGLLTTLTLDATPDASDRVFRYPFLHEGLTLEQRNTVRKFLFDNGYTIAEVTVDWNDWAWNDAYTRCVRRHDSNSVARLQQQVIIAAERQLSNSRGVAKRLFKRDVAQIFVIHDSMLNAAVLASLLRDLRGHGVELITLHRALEDPIYKINPGVTQRDGGTFLNRIAASRGINISDLQKSDYSLPTINNICKQ